MTKIEAKPAIGSVKELFSPSPDGLREIVRAVMQAMLEGGLRLRLAMEPSSASPSEVRGLCSAGVTLPRRSYALSDSRSSRHPKNGGEARSLAQSRSPPITRIALPTHRVHYPSGSRWVLCRWLPHSRGFPRFQGGSASALRLSRPARPPDQVRGSLALCPSDHSAAKGGLCHEAPARSVARPMRSSVTRSIDVYLGGTFLHRRYAPSGRT
jgi:hypothetical protein